MEATVEWISSKPTIQITYTESLPDLRAKVLQTAMDVQFLVEFARRGGYLTDRITNLSSSTISCLEESFISVGLNPLRRCLPICEQNGAKCATCRHLFMNNESRRAFQMDNIIAIFKDNGLPTGRNIRAS